MNLSPDQLQERRELLQQCLNMSVIQAQSYASSLSEEQFLEAINGTTRNMLGMNMRPPATFPDNYFGQYYTIQNGKLRPGNVWNQVELDILQCVTAEREDREQLAGVAAKGAERATDSPAAWQPVAGAPSSCVMIRRRSALTN